jgi:hypothetical protein
MIQGLRCLVSLRSTKVLFIDEKRILIKLCNVQQVLTMSRAVDGKWFISEARIWDRLLRIPNAFSEARRALVSL